jgi:hypothetical protein
MPSVSDPTPDRWEAYVSGTLVPSWLAECATRTPWAPAVMEVTLGPLTYLFDAGPSQMVTPSGDDRVVAVWGRSRTPDGPRDRARQAGFIPVPASWSARGLDRGHLVANAAGGGMDMNIFPQARGLNRGTTPSGRIWRAMERRTVAVPGTPLFVRPIYARGGPRWVPEAIDRGVLADGALWCERFVNRG